MLKKGYSLPRKTGRFIMEGVGTGEYDIKKRNQCPLNTLTPTDKKNARLIIKMLLGPEYKNVKYTITEKAKCI